MHAFIESDIAQMVSIDVVNIMVILTTAQLLSTEGFMAELNM